MSRVLGYTILAGVIASSPARAQTTAELGRRLIGAEADAERARLNLRAWQQRHATPTVATDTIAFLNGTVTVIADRSVGPLVKRALSRADSALRNLDHLTPRLAGAVYRMQRSGNDSTGYEILMSIRRRDARFAADAASMPIDTLETAREIELQTVRRIADDAKTPFTMWRNGSVPYDSLEVNLPIDWGAVRYALLDTRANIAPKCYRGDTMSCSFALGLVVSPQPFFAWYDSLTRFQTIKENKAQAILANADAANRCLKGDDAQCGIALQAIGYLTRPTAGPLAVSSLVVTAVRMGGARAVERMLSSTGSPSDALAAGAGVPIDSVLRVWQRHLHDDAIGSENLSVAVVLTALVWIGVLGFLSTRISRWR